MTRQWSPIVDLQIIIIINKNVTQKYIKTHAKQFFCSQNYPNTILENNFSIHLNISLKNTKQKKLTKHTPICLSRNRLKKNFSKRVEVNYVLLKLH